MSDKSATVLIFVIQRDKERKLWFFDVVAAIDDDDDDDDDDVGDIDGE
jgi:hypothetical protein